MGYVDAGDRYTIDIDAIERRITPRTRLLILNDLHNPTAAECTTEELDRIAAIALEHDLVVLSDEAYFDVRFEGASESIVSRPGMQERTVILYTLNKTYAMTGPAPGRRHRAPAHHRHRHAPQRQRGVVPQPLRPGGPLAALTGDQAGPREMMARLKGRRDAARASLNATPGVSCHTPGSTFYLYPDVSGAVRMTGCEGHEDFRRLLLEQTGVSFCTRQHFGRQPSGRDRIPSTSRLLLASPPRRSRRASARSRLSSSRQSPQSPRPPKETPR